MPAEIYTDLTTVKNALRHQGTAQDGMLSSLIPGVCKAIARQLGRDILLGSNSQNPVTEFLSGRSDRRLLLSRTPVQAPVLSGCATTSGSAVVTVPTSTFLFADQSVTGPGVASKSAILSVDSSTQVTLTKAATLTQSSAALIFGLGVWVDNAAYGGTAPGAFAASTQLFEGTDFWLHRDGPGGNESKTGFVDRISGLWSGMFWGDAAWGYGWSHTPGTLTRVAQAGQGNIRLRYVAGYAETPEDLQLAATRLVVYVYRELIRQGLSPGTDAAMRVAQQAMASGRDPEVGDVKSLLATYRNVPL